MKCRRPLVVLDAPAALLPFVQPNALAAPWVKEGIDKQREGRTSGASRAFVLHLVQALFFLSHGVPLVVRQGRRSGGIPSKYLVYLVSALGLEPRTP